MPTAYSFMYIDMLAPYYTIDDYQMQHFTPALSMLERPACSFTCLSVDDNKKMQNKIMPIFILAFIVVILKY